jgi:hypothetical protein
MGSLFSTGTPYYDPDTGAYNGTKIIKKIKYKKINKKYYDKD